tara:strand:+ start:417 stop:980 length:564 start_codon:yes stop_codon:yes gene_type:complete
MKKVTSLLLGLLILTGCAETVALLGPASTLAGGASGGKLVQSSLSSAVNYGVTKKTGKSPMQHVLNYAEKNNPTKMKDRCISFVKETESEACYIAKKQISKAKNKAVNKIKNVVIFSEPKVVRKMKIEQNSNLKVKKDHTTSQVKLEKNSGLKSVESILIETALNKKQISHLRVSIEKNSQTKDLSK